MKTTLIMTCIVLVQIAYGQKTKPTPSFKIAGVNSGKVSLATILLNDTIQPINSTLKIISAEINIVSGNTYEVTNKGHRLNSDVKGLLRRLQKGQSCKLIISNVKALKEPGDTLILSQPLQITVTH